MNIQTIPTKALLKSDVKAFTHIHENSNLASLLLKGSPFEDIDIQSLVRQIQGRKIAKKKLPNLYHNDNIIYPPRLNLEQASSEITSLYKASFLQPYESIIDITGGVGIDCIAFAQKTKKVTYCEIDSQTYKYAKQNFNTLNLEISTHNQDGLSYLRSNDIDTDWLYIDPARRDNQNNKVYYLNECTPNVIEHIFTLKSACNRLMLKTSPLLDIHICLQSIPNITEIHIVAVKNEVKELLIIANFKIHKTTPTLYAVNLGTTQKIFKAAYTKKNIAQNYKEPLQYLYEPNAAIMKSGFFGKLCLEFGIFAIARHSHLFTSNVCIDFPGRVFRIKKIISPKLTEIKKNLPNLKANVTCRNYPLRPTQIKTKYKIKDGGDCYLFFTTNYMNKKIVLICDKITNT